MAIVALALLAGCGGTPPSRAPLGSPPSTVASLTVGVADDPGSALNIFKGQQTFDPLVDLVYDKLLSPSPYVDEPQPGLATAATMLDPSSWQVTLRTGVTWQDGQPFTADDVKFTYDYYRTSKPNRYSHHVNHVPTIDRIDVVDARTVRFHCAYPCPEAGAITFADLPILPKHVWQNVSDPGTFTGLPVGTGPYRLVDYQPGQLLRFDANPSYFGGRPRVDRLVMPIISDPNTMFTAVKTGEIDVADLPVPPELLGSLGSTPGIGMVQSSPLTAVVIRVNFKRSPFDQPAARAALSMGIDRQKLVDTVLLGHGRPGTLGYPHPDSPWAKPGLAQPYDPAGARRALDTLGFVDRNDDAVRDRPDGSPLEFTLQVAGTDPLEVRAAQLVAESLAAIGIRIDVRPTDTGTIRSLLGSGDYDLYVDRGYAHELADVDQFVMSNKSGLLWSETVPYPEWDALWTQWQATTSVEERKQVTFEMEDLFNRQPTALVLWYPEEHWAFRTSAWDDWADTRGYGIVTKWSFLPAAARDGRVVANLR